MNVINCVVYVTICVIINIVSFSKFAGPVVFAGKQIMKTTRKIRGHLTNEDSLSYTMSRKCRIV